MTVSLLGFSGGTASLAPTAPEHPVGKMAASNTAPAARERMPAFWREVVRQPSSQTMIAAPGTDLSDGTSDAAERAIDW